MNDGEIYASCEVSLQFFLFIFQAVVYVGN